MLEKQSELVRECYERAAEARRRAESATDPVLRADYRDLEERWLSLARSFAFNETLGDFTRESSAPVQKVDDLAREAPPRGAPSGSEEQIHWLASIIESNDDAIVSKDLDGIVRSWNKGAEHLFGYTANEAVGKPITIVIPRDRLHEESTILERIRCGERIEHYETVRQRKDGSLIDVSLTISPVKNARGKIVGASKIGRDITERKQNEKLIATLAREAEHRTKNLLATVQAAVSLSQSETPEGLKHAIEGRIQALANVHALFVESQWTGVELSSLVMKEFAPYSNTDEGGTTRIDGPRLWLEPNRAQAFAVVLHELATNAAKYGALSTRTGWVEVNWSSATDGSLVLRWTERGGPPASAPARKGFGMRVLEQMIKGSLNGQMRLDWQSEGLLCEIALPSNSL